MLKRLIFSLVVMAGLVSSAFAVDMPQREFPVGKISQTRLAQFNGCPPGFCAPSSSAPAVYQGPGNIATYRAWWGLRAYSLATAGTAAANVCNSGDANCADVNTLSNGDFDVATAQGAPLNCGGVGGTCTVKTLYDKTGANQCGGAPCNVTLATAGVRPILVFNCTGLGAGKPCLNFASNKRLDTGGVSMSSDSAPWSMSFVAKRVGSFTTTQTVLQLCTGAFAAAYFQSANNTAGLYAGTAGLDNANATDNTWINLTAIGNGASSSVNVDGTSATPGTNPGSGAQSGIIELGVGCSLANPFGGVLVEAGLSGNDLTANVSALNSNVHAYWGF